jgi:D-erythro-7,8-dihydroneopterin triphosphate epimerase
MIIKIKNLRIDTFIGVYNWESLHQRTLLFNVEIETDFEDSLTSDNINDTVDYDHITKQIQDYVMQNRHSLIEKMVDQILDLIMQDQRIKRCILEVDKLKVYEFVDSFSVTQTRIRSNI